jgi:TfoX/Sxy family transcriptional regulator of competence genes
MSANDDLLEILTEALGRAGAVNGRRRRHRRLFRRVFFAIIDDGAIYFKTSDETRRAFEAERSQPFSYDTKTGRTQLTSYWRLPEGCSMSRKHSVIGRGILGIKPRMTKKIGTQSPLLCPSGNLSGSGRGNAFLLPWGEGGRRPDERWDGTR